MNLLKFIFRVVFNIIRIIWLAVTLICAGVVFIYLIPAAIIGSILYWVNQLLNKILIFLGSKSKVKFKPEDEINESIEKNDSEDIIKQEGSPAS